MCSLSYSKIRLFKACRRAYELKYIYGLEPVEKSEALQTGTSYHEKLEQLYKTGEFDCDFSKETAMAMAYKKYIYPRFAMRTVEEWQKMTIGEDVFVGRVDGIAEDGRIVEHKTTSISLAEYEFNLQWDEQILAYMFLTGAREVYFTVCKKPTIRQKQNESDEEFYNRMLEWYDTDTESKIGIILISRTDEEVQQYFEDLKKMIFEMKYTKNFYRNLCHCKCWGRDCEYKSVCLNYDPEQEYIGFTKGEKEA